MTLMLQVETKNKIVVVGAGIIGLTTAVTLLEAGHAVTVVARDLPPNTTSDVAAAFWYPYKAQPQEKVLPWAALSLAKYYQAAEASGSGVFISSLLELYPRVVHLPWWLAPAYKHRRAETSELPPGYLDGYLAEIPVIEAPIYLQYLLTQISAAGGEIILCPRGITHLRELQAPGRIVVNCTGLGSVSFCDDQSVFPIKGQVLKVAKPELSTCILDEHGAQALAYIVPRQNDCVLGGTAETGIWDDTVDAEISQSIMARCSKIVPAVAGSQILEARTGLRPGRDVVRLEREQLSEDCFCIHNYGHGGAGFTVCWGCAADVLKLVESAS